ncbi:hypothetical protein PSD17_35060 [Pseudonocardia sp. D17]|nr:hypothetical protein PSD17_35060 [Pseudonocardia sp. D17]
MPVPGESSVVARASVPVLSVPVLSIPVMSMRGNAAPPSTGSVGPAGRGAGTADPASTAAPRSCVSRVPPSGVRLAARPRPAVSRVARPPPCDSALTTVRG